MPKKEINIVWYKRDLRFTDHEPLYQAQQANLPILLIYLFEPSVIAYPDSDVRHWRFIHESLSEMNEKLKSVNTQIHIFHSEAELVFSHLINHYSINRIFSYEEIGNGLTYDRDKRMQVVFKENKIVWKEFQTNGIIRKLKSRNRWGELWEKQMTAPVRMAKEEDWNSEILKAEFYSKLKGEKLSTEITTRNTNFQEGGESWAWKYLDSFVKKRHVNYSYHISKPLLSRKGCSRMSPYLAYGNISMRMVYQYTKQHYVTSENKRALSNFISRLHWHCHFIQKFEDECRYEFENVNRAYDSLVKPRNDTYIIAWQTGQTGVPLIDACMRCLIATGYINFRMRAMVVSFFVYNLWQDWRELHFLARQFLDYEPGIHYPQLQMQSGTTGMNTIRIYNPIKNSEEHDTEGLFIKQWLPELKNVPIEFIHEPYKMTLIEQQMYECVIGESYPRPIVDIEATRKIASDIVWSFRKKDEVKLEAKRILDKHVNQTSSFITKKKKTTKSPK
jgi:deoxyribodipyrimidine photo-lyase